MGAPIWITQLQPQAPRRPRKPAFAAPALLGELSAVEIQASAECCLLLRPDRAFLSPLKDQEENYADQKADNNYVIARPQSTRSYLCTPNRCLYILH